MLIVKLLAVFLLPLVPAISAAAVDIYFFDEQAQQLRLWDSNNTPGLPGPHTLPVLFIHGHKLLGGEPHYRKTWVDPPSYNSSLSSFAQIIDANPWLEIEPYYINFGTHNGVAISHNRSIADDAQAIDEGVWRILEHHHGAHEWPPALNRSPRVQIAVIAYSKGTISTRLYLKSRQTQQYNLPAPEPDFHPISTFVALSPPNHGLRVQPWEFSSILSSLAFEAFQASTPIQQLSNGFRGDNCWRTQPAAADSLRFMDELNGHPSADTHADNCTVNANLECVNPVLGQVVFYDSEAPGNRPNLARETEGALYVTLFDGFDRDSAGGALTHQDCTTSIVFGSEKQGRKLALNLAREAVNIPLGNPTNPIPDSALIGAQNVTGSLAVHANTPHHVDAICQALYAAVHREAEPGFDCRQQINNQTHYIIPKPPPQVALVLDTSGSMMLPACPGCSLTRHEALQDAADLFVSAWQQALNIPWNQINRPQEHQIGVTYFNSGASTFAFPGSADALAPVCAMQGSCPNAGAVIANINSPSTAPSGLTALGQGLAAGVDVLQAPGPSRNRHIILLSDGLQNVAPLVQANAQQQLEINLGAQRLVLDHSLGIIIHTIAIGAGQPFTALLSDIASATGGSAAVTVDPQQDLRRIYFEQLVGTLRGNSPQLIDYRSDILYGGQTREDFFLNRSAKALVLGISWRRGDAPIGFSVMQNGVDVTRSGSVVSGAFYRFFSVDFSAQNAVRPGGAWSVFIEGAQSQPYELALLADEKALYYTSSVTPQAPRAGDILALQVKLASKTGRALAGTEVRAIVSAPERSVATLLVTQPALGSGYNQPSEPGLSRYQQKIEALQQDPEFADALGASQTQISLQEVEPGIFQGLFGDTAVPGVYRIRFQIDANDPEHGVIQRTETQSAIVRFAGAIAGESELYAQLIAETAGYAEYMISFRPRDRFGNYLGPGRSEMISVALSETGAVQPPDDLGDGTYLIFLERPSGSDTELSIRIGDEDFYQGSLARLL